MDEIIYFWARTVFACMAALILLVAYASAAEPAGASAEPPAFSTLLAQDSVAGTAAAGETLRVTSTLTLPTGERFAQVERNGSAYWIQLGAEAPLPREGETLTLTQATTLLSQPVAEVEEPAEGDDTGGDNTVTGRPPRGGSSQYPLVPGKLGMSQTCTNFIDPAGHFGPWGSFLMEALSPSRFPNLFRNNVGDMDRVCPRFQQMREDQKKNFWVWLLAAMANHESGCRERITARGVNGIAAGLLQLHLRHESQYGCEPGTNSLRALDNLKCGLVILNNDVDRTDRVFPHSDNYWQVLRIQTPAGQRTYRLAQKYAPCH